MASARSITARQNDGQRNEGSGPASRMRSRGARGTRASYTSISGQMISRERPSTSRTLGRVSWKLTNSSASIVAKRVASYCAPRKVRALVADSPASFQPLKAHTSAGARRPSGRCSQRNGCIPNHRNSTHFSRLGWAASGPGAMIGGVSVGAGGPTRSLASLRAGDEIAGVYACTRKDRLTARTGVPYLALELRDRSGALPARAFRDADLLAGRFERGDLVRVSGRVERFRDELQVEIRAIARAETADPAAFLPVAYRDLEELEGFLEHLPREVNNPEYAALPSSLLVDDGLRAAWRLAPCTRAGHHAYLGGLL